MPDPTAPPRTWATDTAPPGGPRRRRLLVVLLALVAVTGGVVGLAYWFAAPQPPAALPLYIVAAVDGTPVPGLDGDRAALAEFFGPADANPTRDQLRYRFATAGRRGRPLVVVLAAPAGVDAAGVAYLLPADPLGDHPRNRLPLADLLALLRDGPAAKFVALQLVPSPADPPPPGELARAVGRALDAVPDPTRLVLAACSPGEDPQAVPGMNRTLFGVHLEAGLHGHADGWGPTGDRDGRVTAAELAAFVRARVARWAQGAPQTPLLVGDGPDFALRSYPLSDPPAAAPPDPPAATPYPDWLKAAWEKGAAPGPLLAAERAVFAGAPADPVRARLDRSLVAASAKSVAPPRPDPVPTLAAAFPGYTPPDATLTDTLAELTRGPAKATDPPPPAFAELLKKPHAELALAAFRVLADDPAPSAVRVKRLADLLRTHQPAPQFAEVVLVQRLAELGGPDWSPARAAVALRAARDLEDAAAAPGLLARAAPAADAAYRAQAFAQAVLFAPGYAAAGEADARLATAADAAATLRRGADQLRAADAARVAGRAWLDGAAVLVNGGRVPAADADRVAAAYRRLVEALAVPTAPLDAAALTAAGRDWDARAAELRAAVAAGSAAVAPTALAAVRTAADGGDPAARRDLDVLLASPLVPPAERQQVWDARERLTRALAARALHADAVEADAIRLRRAAPTSPDPREVVGDRGEATTRWATVLPPSPADAARDARALWGWQAARFAYEAADPLGLVDAGAGFAARAARACAAAGGLRPGPALDLSRPSGPVVVTDPPRGDAALTLRLLNADKAATLPVRVHTPDAAWLRAAVPAMVTADPARGVAVPVSLDPPASPVRVRGAKGVLVEAEAGGRPFARRVDVSLDALLNRLELYTRAGPADAPRVPAALALRPNGRPQPLQFLLGNPTDAAKTVVARIPALGRATAPVKVEPGKLAPLTFPAPPPVPGAMPATEPAAAPLPDPLVIELHDPADPRTPPQTFSLPVRVLDPADFLAVEDVTFRPAGVRPNRLALRVVPGAVPAGQAVAVAADLPAARNPDVIQIRDANLGGPLPADGQPLTLYADDIAFARPGGARLVVTVGADGVERAFTFAGEVPATGGSVRLARDTTPAVRVAAERYAVPGVPLPVRVEVDHAPPGATVEVRVGTGPRESFAADVVHSVRPAKDRSAAAAFDQTGETLLVRGSVRDPEPKVPVGLLVGERALEARLLDATGKELGFARTAVVFDGTPPANVRFLDLPTQAGKGQPLVVRAACDPPVSGLGEVKFFVGKVEKGQLPSAPPPAPGQLLDAKGNVWAATLAAPKDADRVTVGVRFVSKTGLATIETAEIELVDPAELAKPRPGAIAGKVVEGGLTPDGLPVFLYDAKRAPLAQTKTAGDGTFAFRDLPPGPYVLFARREETNREAMVDVTVAPAAVARPTLELFLRGGP